MGIINALPDQYVPEATPSAAGLMSATDKTKLNGIESGAQANPGNASTSAAGLMSAEDKTKLNGIATGATAVEVVDSLSDTSTTKALSAGKGKELSDQIANNYTDYDVSNDYHIRVAIMGKIVVVSGVIYGTGTGGYLSLSLPSPAHYNESQGLLANAIVFYARNQTNGSIIQLRCGGSFSIYREASMTSGNQYAFAFSYCKA